MRIEIDRKWCKGCELCINTCTQGALHRGTVRSDRGYLMPEADAGKCVGCTMCERICPDLCINVIKG